MNNWRLEIEKVNNGYILEGKFGDTEIKTKKTIEEKGENGELMAMRNLLWEIQEYFAIFNSKHNEYNLEIKVINKDGKELDE